MTYPGHIHLFNEMYTQKYILLSVQSVLNAFGFALLFKGGTSFVGHLCYLCFVFVILSGLFVAALWSPAGRGLACWLLFVIFGCVFRFPMWYPECGT